MTSPLIETVARAICVGKGINPDETATMIFDLDTGTSKKSKAWEHEVKHARAALLAIEGAGYVLMPTQMTPDMRQAFDEAFALQWDVSEVLYAALLSSGPRVTSQ